MAEREIRGLLKCPGNISFCQLGNSLNSLLPLLVWILCYNQPLFVSHVNIGISLGHLHKILPYRKTEPPKPIQENGLEASTSFQRTSGQVFFSPVLLLPSHWEGLPFRSFLPGPSSSHRLSAQRTELASG